MITLTYEPSEEMKEFTVERIEIKAQEEGSIEDYIMAFDTFLRAVGFVDGTIEKALPYKNPRLN